MLLGCDKNYHEDFLQTSILGSLWLRNSDQKGQQINSMGRSCCDQSYIYSQFIKLLYISLYKKSKFPALNCAPRKYEDPDYLLLKCHVNQIFHEKVLTILGTIIADISHNRWCTFFKRCTFGIESAKFWPVLAISGYFVANISTFWRILHRPIVRCCKLTNIRYADN